MKKKFLKWWAQSFLVNIQEIHCGFRDNRGIIKDIVRFKTRDLPKLSSVIFFTPLLEYLFVIFSFRMNGIGEHV